ncbi:MAG: hypothetical protein R2713_07920 [Ilumatobacteraceae bacterium]
MADSIGDVIGVGTTLVAIGDRTSTSGLSSTHPFQVPRDVVLWTSVETSGEPDSVCDLARRIMPVRRPVDGGGIPRLLRA